MSIWSKLLGSESVITGGMAAIDKAIYTKEEQADNANTGVKLKAMLLKSYEPFKLAQRILMLIVVPPYMAAWFITWAASFAIDVSRQEALLSGDIGSVVMIICGFYFGGGTIESLTKIFKLK